MVYRLSFFGRCGEQNAQDAIGRLLDEVLTDGASVLAEVCGPVMPVDEVAAYRLATRTPEGMAEGDRLTLEVHLGVAHNAEVVIRIDPDDARGIWGSDLYAVISLSGGHPDWVLVDRIWAALERLWSAVAWDEQSGFDLSRGIPT
ncbi:hypothetical protein KDK95_02275 [Actinospica sp. MGRD01-02]|uniref:Uncharacterized protein n=1 Tax=Actinospica acidithermotolerans TaxID=2828514 RepID=A0A941IGX6_9ACTN|nr:hypothetical protein [Actinospica acidithermotolerans]MBR7825117.1 hypothetical protein [Actinospica acidithermotolerans]